ncbi:MAG TPA: SDR family NAD(P)-dependent oxidoreductase [Acidimicrobiales bacterium]|nr:SDR family NAD(P)-dependent oxidoreductase [Acidimicrobiales bacterium]
MIPAGSALVTGASRGIGRAVAVELAERGFDVVAAMRDPADGKDLVGGRMTVARMDVTDPSTIVIPDDLRVLVNNAGVDHDHTPVEHADPAAWRAMFETNVMGVLHVTQAAVPVLRANAPAVVCNVTSSSILAPVAFYAGYRASKAAVSAVCDGLRTELAPFGVRVVEILPGPVDTDMFRVTAGEPPAARFELYREMAEAGAEGRRLYADPLVVPPAQAASDIVDALLDDDGPMRHSCDPVGKGLLDLWRQTDDESLYQLVTGAPAAPDPAVVAAADDGRVQGHVPGHLLTELGMRRVDDPEAGPCLELDLRPEVTNPHGGLHGGLMAALIECGAASVAVRACESEMIVAGDLVVRFLSPVKVGPARVVGRVLRVGRRQVVVQADVLDIGDDRRLAASSTLAYTRL